MENIAVGLAIFVVIMTILVGISLKFFARQLSFYQFVLISLAGSAATVAALLSFYVLQIALQLPRAWDGVAALCAMSIGGTTITRLARSYGLEKSGRVGVGAKTMLGVLVLSWVLIGIFYVITLFLR